MKSVFSKTWVRSKQPRKQRKYVANAPLHIKGKMVRAHLSKDLQKKYAKRSLRLRVGDKVKILRGTHKGEEQKIESVNIKKTRVYIEKMDLTKKDGSKTRIPFHPSNLMLTDLNLDDKKRAQKLKGIKKEVVETKKTEVKKQKTGEK
ncbi:50S ribosomal protein L24 [archaeon]|nr:50S ribosomal protein L24 [archaeon]MBL7056713.1 50S ribosomal protein L24 [Candidatus Woesearchaeota archaeon]